MRKNGLYYAYPPEFEPQLADENYEGFRIVYVRDQLYKSERAPNVISDTMDAVRNPIDGKMYDSKAKYYRTVRQAGCEIAGNDPAVSRPRAEKELSSSDRKNDIARAFS